MSALDWKYIKNFVTWLTIFVCFMSFLYFFATEAQRAQITSACAEAIKNSSSAVEVCINYLGLN